MLEAMMLGVPFCELGREGKTGVQVHFPALGGASGVLDAEIRKSRDSVRWAGCGGDEQMVHGGGCRQDRMESLQFAGFLFQGLLLL